MHVLQHRKYYRAADFPPRPVCTPAEIEPAKFVRRPSLYAGRDCTVPVCTVPVCTRPRLNRPSCYWVPLFPLLIFANVTSHANMFRYGRIQFLCIWPGSTVSYILLCRWSVLLLFFWLSAGTVLTSEPSVRCVTGCSCAYLTWSQYTGHLCVVLSSVQCQHSAGEEDHKWTDQEKIFGK